MTPACEADFLSWRDQLVERVIGEIQETFSQTEEGAFPMRSRHFWMSIWRCTTAAWPRALFERAKHPESPLGKSMLFQ